MIKVGLDPSPPTHLLVQLAFVDVDLLVGLVEGLLKDGDVLVVLLTLQHQLLDVALLLPQDLDCLLVTSGLLIQ